MKKLYALYKGDEFIDIGTKEYLAKLLNVKLSTIEFYATKTHLERDGNDCYIVVRAKCIEKN